MQLLRRYDLVDELENPKKLLEELQKIIERSPTPENVYAYSELAYVGGNKLQDKRRLGDALDLYGASVAQAYEYLLGMDLRLDRNPYDPLFRRASDIYNGALENALRIVKKKGTLKPGTTHTINTATQELEVSIVCRGRWQPEEFERLEFASDYDVTGLQNHYRTYGLGVPLIAVHSGHSSTNPASNYYAPGMSFPVTAFLRVLPDSLNHYSGGKKKHYCMLELYDPMEVSEVDVNGQSVPLETDLSTPLAYSLSDETFQKANVATRGFLNVEKSREVHGLYMLEAYDPQKIPVLMVHGLWSSLITWMEMFNDLRGEPQIRDRYQFWFYLYPTGQPFWISSAQLRETLVQARLTLDPNYSNQQLDQMVLVGHSMGGLISRMQSIESGDSFWHLLSDQPIKSLDLSDELRDEMQRMFFFQPNQSIQRVITIASPHRGSNFSNGATQWLSRKVIKFPTSFDSAKKQLIRMNRDSLKLENLERLQTSVDTLSPESPILPVIDEAVHSNSTRYHNIIGLISDHGVLSKVAGESDGVVTTESARLAIADSEILVDADHVNIHRHPRTILEVRRILLAHLRDQQALYFNHPEISRLPVVDRELR